MADIHFVMLFNGTGNDDHDPALTNVVKMRDGLIKDDKQFVIYRDGIGNDKQWGWLTAWFAKLTGWGGSWIMHSAYRELLNTIKKGLAEGKIKPNDTLHFSVDGFSRGAALARHFAIHYLQTSLIKDISSKFKVNLKVKLDAEYLFDTVGAFGIPLDIWLLTKLGIYNQKIDPGWDFDIPKNTKAYHALSVDDKRKPFTPKLIDENELIEEVWFDGDHSSVGGGHAATKKNEVLSDENPLRYMVRRAIENGLRFSAEFIKKYNIFEYFKNPLGTIKTPEWKELPETQRGPREIYVQKNNAVSKSSPVIAESVIQRMKNDQTYRPEALRKLKQFFVLKEDHNVEAFSAKAVTQLWSSLDGANSPKILKFQKSPQKGEEIPAKTTSRRKTALQHK